MNPDPATPGDRDLLTGLRAGDEGAFAALYRRWQGPLYRFALRMSGSPAMAEDVTQEVFMTLMSEAARYDPARGPLSSYLYGIARNMVLQRLERERGFVPLAEGNEEGPPGDGAGERPEDPLAEIVRRERVDLVWRAVRALPPH